MSGARWLGVALAALVGCGSDPGESGGRDGGGVDAGTATGNDATPGTADAASPDAGELPVGDPADPGPHAVTTTDVSIPTGGGVVSATVYRPATAGRHPLVIVSPGFQMPRAQYASYGAHLAGWGFVVIAQDFPSGFSTPHTALAAQTRNVIDWALSDASGLGGVIDAGRIGACGHSLGGKISLLAAADDARIGAVVGWDPVDAGNPSVTPERMDDIAAAVAVLGETLNGSGGFMPCAPADQNFQKYFTAASPPALEVTVNGADHMDWVDDTSCAFCGLCTPEGTIDEDAVRTVTRRVTVAWLRRRLLGELAMDAYLGGDGLAAGLPAGAVSVRAK